MEIGNHVSIGSNCVVEAATIGNGVEVGKNCIIVRSTLLVHRSLARLTPSPLAQGSLSIIHEYSKIHDGAVLGPRTIVPSLTEWAGNPGQSPRAKPALPASRLPVPIAEPDCLHLRGLTARPVGLLPESTPELVEAKARTYYQKFKPE